MKNFFITLLCCLLFACAEKKGSERAELSQLTFSLDTIMIDSGEEILYLRDNLWVSDISKDGKYLFNYNRKDAVMEKIDLDQQKLVGKILFEKEGPDGVGDYISDISITADESVVMWYYGLTSIFNQQAKLVRNLNFGKITSGEVSESDTFLYSIYENSENPDRFLGFYLQWKDQNFFLLDVDVKNETYRKIELPELNKIKEFSVDLLFDGQWVGNFGADVRPEAFMDKIIITNNSFNEAYIYDMSIDSLIMRAFNSVLLGNKKSFLPPKQLDFESSQRWDVDRKLKEDINFGSIHWDAGNQRYLRLSYQEKFGEEMIENRGYKAIGAEVFLSVFDKDFNLLAESVVPQLNKRAAKHFVKDGQIWIFENIDDEMAFLRLEILDR